MRSTLLSATLALTVLAPSASIAATVALTLGDNGTSLVFLGDVTASAAPVSREIRNSASGDLVSLTDIDFERETGTLYGASAASDSVYSIDPATGLATLRAALPSRSDAEAIFIDWNNSVDRLRLLTSEETNGEDSNFVFNQDANTVTQFTALSYISGDPNEGLDPLLIGNAYRDAVATGGPSMPPPQGGSQLGIDAETNALVGIGNNAGTLTTLATFGFDVTGPGGFDTFSTPDGSGGFGDVGYALLRGALGAGNATSLFSFALPDDLSGGISLTLLRTFDETDDFQGLALIDSASLPDPLPPIPLPASLFLSAAGLAGLGLLRLRKRRVAG